MQDFIPGQRWINDVELQLGLGTVLESDLRTVTIVFMSTGETRTFAKQSASLTRVMFGVGDRVRSQDGKDLKVDSIHQHKGLLIYVGTDQEGNRIELHEGQLDHFMQMNRPQERLFNGQIDLNKWFELREQTLRERYRLAHSNLYGLGGCRTSLIPHQLYIAYEVSRRYAPRVLLADEVGLGKTIEAGLILHHQLLTGRAQRILIVVPQSLVHQWLVEMQRRFNLRFSIFDEDRCQALDVKQTDGEPAQNPFHSEQLILCDLEFIVDRDERFQQALAGNWDLVVVDEAHHLEWSPEHASLEYTLIEKLAAKTKGLLLLTATPEQLGKAGHFARLRLLDPDRFADYSTFIEEETRYEPIAQAMEALLDEKTVESTGSTDLDRHDTGG